MSTLRQLSSADKAAAFAQLRTRLEGNASMGIKRAEPVLPLGIPAVDTVIGGLPLGALTEVVQAPECIGSGLLTEALMRVAQRKQGYLSLIDGHNRFDPESVDPALHPHLLWVRCKQPEQALEAADILLRDSNFHFHVMDLQGAPVHQLKRLPSHVWYRFQRLLRQNGSVLLCITPQGFIPSAQLRLQCSHLADIEQLDQPRARLVTDLRLELDRGHRNSGAAQTALA
ncbi:MAG: hypothetical protein JJU20_13325 [Opitutales bacterium]|nr:hypothetical protein [Opitutales bacterium]